MVTLPAATPLTTPVDGLIVAINGLLLVHSPPVARLVIVVLAPAQTLDAPTIVPAFGALPTVTLAVVVAAPQLPPTV
jgi:hypothetical protein